jgi:hypothetical protein
MIRYNPKWTDKIDLDIAEYISNGTPFNRIEPSSMGQKYIIQHLAEKGCTFQVITLGAGVKRITTETTICPKCNGTGKC